LEIFHCAGVYPLRRKKLYMAGSSRKSQCGPSLICLYVIPTMPEAVFFVTCGNGDDIFYGDWFSERLRFVDMMVDARLQYLWF